VGCGLKIVSSHVKKSIVCCAPAIAIHPPKLTASVKAISVFILSSLHSGSTLNSGKVLPESYTDPGTACISLDNGSIPLYTETCQHVENSAQGEIAIAACSEPLFPQIGNDVSECVGIARSRRESEQRLVLQTPSLRMPRAVGYRAGPRHTLACVGGQL
jgi:hypothetical protein